MSVPSIGLGSSARGLPATQEVPEPPYREELARAVRELLTRDPTSGELSLLLRDINALPTDWEPYEARVFKVACLSGRLLPDISAAAASAAGVSATLSEEEQRELVDELVALPQELEALCERMSSVYQRIKAKNIAPEAALVFKGSLSCRQTMLSTVRIMGSWVILQSKLVELAAIEEEPSTLRSVTQVISGVFGHLRSMFRPAQATPADSEPFV